MALKTISFESAQHVQVEFELASSVQRMLASLIDVLILLLYIVVVLFAFGNFKMLEQFTLLGLVIKIPFVIYFPFMEFAFGRSLGKMAMGLRIVSMEGERTGLREIMIRWVFRGDYVWLTADFFMFFWFGFGLVGFVICHTSDLGQRLGDSLAGTLVIRETSSMRFSLKQIHAIQQAEGYLPMYPEVIRFTDEDMILVKNTLMRLNKGSNKEVQKFAAELSLKLSQLLELKEVPRDTRQFFDKLLQDYIVITR
jgi:uncharacterized RDD family membrane protein YckC